jgi:hypothetical protein
MDMTIITDLIHSNQNQPAALSDSTHSTTDSGCQIIYNMSIDKEYTSIYSVWCLGK